MAIAITGDHATWNTPGGFLHFGCRTLEGPGIVAVVGASGGGKSTLLRALAGIHPLHRGQVAVVPDDAHQALLFQQPEWQLWGSSVADAVGRRHPYFSEAVQRFALEPLLDRHPYQLSGGERRRVALASIEARRPAIILLDEPASGLDGSAKAATYAAIADWAGRSLILVASHDWPWLTSSVSRCLWMEGMAVTHDAPPTALLPLLSVPPRMYHLARALQAGGIPVHTWWDPRQMAKEIAHGD